METLQNILTLDIFCPFFRLSLGSCQINHESLLVQAFVRNVFQFEIISIIIPLEGFHVFQEEIAAEHVVDGDFVVWITFCQFAHDGVAILVQS